MGFRGGNATGGRIVLLPSACWAHGAFKIMANLGAARLLRFLKVPELRRACFHQARVAQAVPLPGALFHTRNLALHLCAPQIPLVPAPTFREQKINANFFWTKFFENPSGRGSLHQKSWTSAPKNVFSCGPGDGETLKLALLKFYCRGVSHEKQRFWTIFLSAP